MVHIYKSHHLNHNLLSIPINKPVGLGFLDPLWLNNLSWALKIASFTYMRYEIYSSINPVPSTTTGVRSKQFKTQYTIPNIKLSSPFSIVFVTPNLNPAYATIVEIYYRHGLLLT